MDWIVFLCIFLIIKFIFWSASHNMPFRSIFFEKKKNKITSFKDLNTWILNTLNWIIFVLSCWLWRVCCIFIFLFITMNGHSETKTSFIDWFDVIWNYYLSNSSTGLPIIRIHSFSKTVEFPYKFGREDLMFGGEWMLFSSHRPNRVTYM